MASARYNPCPSFTFATHRPPHFELAGSDAKPVQGESTVFGTPANKGRPSSRNKKAHTVRR